MKRWQTWVAGAMTAACLILFARFSAHDLWRPDAFDYAQIARELVEGRGFSSRQAIYVLHLRFLHEHGLIETDWPNLHRFPLPSVAIAACFLVFGVGNFSVMAYGIFFHSLTAMLLLHWARLLGGDARDPVSNEPETRAPPPRTIGPWLGPAVVALFAFNGVLLETGSSGLAEPCVLFFFTLALYLVWRIRDEPHPVRFVGLGLALGLAALGRTNIVFVVPLFAFFTFRTWPWRQDRALPEADRRVIPWGGLALLLGSFLLVISPWLIRNQQVAGSPLFSLHSYFLLPAGQVIGGDKWDLAEPWVWDFVPPLEYARENLTLVMAKWRHNAATMLRAFPRFGGTYLLPLVALAATVVSSGRGTRPLAWLVVLSLSVNAFLVNFTDTYFDKYYFHLLPALMLLAVAVVERWLQWIPAARLRVGLFLLAVLIMADLPGILTAHRRVEAYSTRFPEPNMAFIRQHTDDAGVVFSDHSYAVAWTTGRRTVRSYLQRPESGETVLAALRFREEFDLPVTAIYLSQICLQDPEWRLALDNSRRDPRFREAFPREHVFADGSVLLYRPPASSGAA